MWGMAVGNKKLVSNVCCKWSFLYGNVVCIYDISGVFCWWLVEVTKWRQQRHKTWLAVIVAITSGHSEAKHREFHGTRSSCSAETGAFRSGQFLEVEAEQNVLGGPCAFVVILKPSGWTISTKRVCVHHGLSQIGSQETWSGPTLPWSLGMVMTHGSQKKETTHNKHLQVCIVSWKRISVFFFFSPGVCQNGATEVDCDADGSVVPARFAFRELRVLWEMLWQVTFDEYLKLVGELRLWRYHVQTMVEKEKASLAVELQRTQFVYHVVFWCLTCEKNVQSPELP